MKVSYDSAAAGEAEAGLRATAAQLEQTLQELTSYVAGVCAGWEGDEQVQYKEIQGRWDSAAREVHEILTRITQALNTNTQSVDRMRQQVRSTLAR